MKVSVRKERPFDGKKEYILPILAGRIHLEDIPKCVLRRWDYAYPIYKTVFCIDAAFSREQYLSHLDFLKNEIEFLAAIGTSRQLNHLKHLHAAALKKFYRTYGHDMTRGNQA